jgi:hypothetical protein
MRCARKAGPALCRVFEFRVLFQKQIKAIKESEEVRLLDLFFRAQSDCNVWRAEAEMGSQLGNFPSSLDKK